MGLLVSRPIVSSTPVAATNTTNLEPSLLVLGPAIPPVTLVTTSTATSPIISMLTPGLDATGLNVLNLVFAIVFRALDQQLLSAVPLGLGIQLEELLLRLFRVELNEHTSLEGTFLRAA